MTLKIIRTQDQYEQALTRIEELMELSPVSNSDEANELGVLSVLVDKYESEVYPIETPSPIEAIKFRMEQQELQAKDLVPYIGSESKVSEVLSGKRQLSRTMISKLSFGLGIPAEILLPKIQNDLSSKYPVKEMLKRGYFGEFAGTLKDVKKDLFSLLENMKGPLGPAGVAYCRQQINSDEKTDENALSAWRMRVANLAMRENLPKYLNGAITHALMRDIACLSRFDDGPLKAKRLLIDIGIPLIVERHLPKTYLDGAVIKLTDGRPAIGLTLRHDRLDNFWFTLLHELGHILLHFDKTGIDAFFDDIQSISHNQIEREADSAANDALIPQVDWENARLDDNSSCDEVISFSQKIQVSPCIIAGRIRFESNNYRMFKDLITNYKVRVMFGL